MKNKIYRLIVAVMLVLASSFFFVACESDEQNGGISDNSSAVISATDGSSGEAESSSETGHTHSYEFAEFVWTGFTAQAKYVCAEDNDTVYFDAVITEDTTKEPTCKENGEKTYTAAYDGHTDTKKKMLGKAEHTFEDGYCVVCGEKEKVYFTVSFDSNGGSDIESVKAENLTKIAKPVDPVKKGYDFDGWYLDEEKWSFIGYVVSEDITLTARWKGSNDTEYKTEYYFENTDDDGFSYAEDETTVNYGTTEDAATAVIKEFAHFTRVLTEDSVETAVINGDGTTVLKVFYTRERFALSVSAGAGVSLSGEYNGEYKYQEEVELSATFDNYIGYELNWYSGSDLLSSGDTLRVTIDGEKSVTVSREIKKAMKVFYFNSDSQTCEITGLKDKSLSEIIIPDSVTSIGCEAFRYCSGLTIVTIGNGVTSIGDIAFYGCSGLTSVTIPDGVTIIGEGAFYNCNNLTSVTIGNGVTSIGSSAFRSCSSLTDINVSRDNNYYTSIDGNLYSKDEKTIILYAIGKTDALFAIPDSVTSIGDGAFYGCSSLTSITIPDSVTSISSSAFDGCSSLKSITIPDSVTSIGYGAFSGCSSLTSVTIPDGVTSIGGSAFSYCSGLQYNEYDNAYYLGNDNNRYVALIIAKNKEITSVSINSETKIICSSAFSSCGSLTSITIPDSVTSIGYEAFYNCNNLTSVTIGNGVTSIGGSAFYRCSSLTSVTIGNGVTSIGSDAFNRCSSLTSVTIPDSVTSIGSSAFQDCSSLTSITIPDSVTSIGDYAFDNCLKLVEVYNKSYLDITASSSTHGYVAYYAKNVYTPTSGESKLSTDNDGYVIYTDGDSVSLIGYAGNETEIILPDNITEIYKCAFHNCTGLTSITIPDGVTSIREGAFLGCSGLTNIIIPDSVTSIGDIAFYGCSGLTTVTIPDGVASIGGYAFYNCTGLTSITIPDSVTSIGYDAFYGCSGLTSIIIPDSVTSIGKWAFGGCSALTSITIPDGVTSIGYYAFGACNSLTSVTFENASGWKDDNGVAVDSSDLERYIKEGKYLTR